MSDARGLKVLEAGHWDKDSAAGVLDLDYEARLVRRKRLRLRGGEAVLLDLPQVTSLSDGAGLELDDGRCILICAAQEQVLAVSGPDLLRYVWHIGNRHTPCEMGEGVVFIKDDPVLKGMLEGLGAQVTAHLRAFQPEGGAYGHGRTMGHDHAPAPHSHAAHSHASHSHAPHSHSHD
ncbi:Urease accessory protein UreE 1 [Aquimixticola soesokkakensis]|uniref:Urease accessory protein UreE n=1 Tax=Aquimixticola soesokkakensis TaxID=1519096 RepID=A0A1Y5S0A8_9RHOB|nr:hypothetical protein [Aquimixticola soesokkakensis]SLN29438.1 Urease accessory protein UreE 1 [Aquimixticola soesokkakensis]